MQQYKNAYKQGLWDERATTSPIMISDAGKLAAGQHRMQMQVDLEIKEMVHPILFDASTSQAEFQDTNANRSLNDKTQQKIKLKQSILGQPVTGIPKVDFIQPRTFLAAIKILDTEIWFSQNINNQEQKVPTKDGTSLADLIEEYYPTFVKVSASFKEDATTPLYGCAFIVAAIVYAYKNQIHGELKLNDFIKRSNYSDSEPTYNDLHLIFTKKGEASNPKSQYTKFKETLNFIKKL